jgi:hypothetical protein
LRVLSEYARQLALADMGNASHARQCPGFIRRACDRVLHPVHSRMKMIALLEPGRNLRITSGASREDDQLSRDTKCTCGPEYLSDRPQRKIDPSRDARARRDVTVDNVDAVLQHFGARRDRSERSDQVVMRCARTSVKPARMCRK